MSGYDASNNTYIQTWDDACYVFFWIVVFTGARAATMDFILKPFAKWGGIQTKKGRTRFAEQGWLFVYYSGFWALGMVSIPSIFFLCFCTQISNIDKEVTY